MSDVLPVTTLMALVRKKMSMSQPLEYPPYRYHGTVL
jgi:hypothetical protein